MSAQQTPVNVRLETNIQNQSHQDKMILEEKGKYYQKGEAHILIFKEHHEEGQVVNTMFTIHPDRVTIKRSGPVNMHQIFRLNEETESHYKHPYGVMHLLTKTNKLMHHFTNEKVAGQLSIDYKLTLNGQETQQHKLVLSYQEEG